jgi:hypothetical protein
MEDARIQIVPLQLTDGTIIKVQATTLGGSQDVLDLEKILPFNEVTDTIEKVAQAVVGTLQKIKPDKASVEFGIEVGIESGDLTALLVKGTGTGNLKIMLQWGK